jgi:hypothetical protein
MSRPLNDWLPVSGPTLEIAARQFLPKTRAEYYWHDNRVSITVAAHRLVHYVPAMIGCNEVGANQEEDDVGGAKLMD